MQDDLRDRVEPMRGELAGRRRRLDASSARPRRPAGTGYEALIARPLDRRAGGRVRPEDPFALMYTSGTTGQPEGRDPQPRRQRADRARDRARDAASRATTPRLLVMPMCHANSLYFGLTFMYLGATVVVDDRKSFDPEALLATLARRQRHLHLAGADPLHHDAGPARAAMKARYDVSAVGKLLISSAPARKETKLAIMEHFSQLAACSSSTARPRPAGSRCCGPTSRSTGSARSAASGSARAPIRMLDADGREVPDGEVGELFSRTPYVFDGYWKNPEKTAEAFRGDWCSVGDMARRDADGYIHLVDRKSNMIISGGENIYPSEVEGVIGAHPEGQGRRGDRRARTTSGARRCRPWSCCTTARQATEAELHRLVPRPHGRLQAAAHRSPSSPTRRCRAPRPARSSTACCASA